MSKRSFESDKMTTCAVMYQPYAMSSSYAVCDRPPAEKKPFRFPYVPSPPDSLHSEGSSYSHSSPGPSAQNNASSPLSLNLNLSSSRRPLTPLGSSGGGGIISSFSSPPATITSASQLLQMQQQLQQQQHGSESSLRSPQSRHSSIHVNTHNHNGGGSTAASSASSSSSSASATITSHTVHHHNPTNLEEAGGGNNENDNVGPVNNGSNGSSSSRVQYLSANCVVYENYREDTAKVVEEHFSRTFQDRAASVVGSATKCSPMSTRNFPPSFWNSNYQPSKPFVNMSYGSDFYGAAMDYGSTLSGLSHHHHQTDPWPHYPLASHQGYHHRATDLTYPPMPSTSRFNAAQYGSFFLAGAAASTSAASRFAVGAGAGGQCGANLKGDTTAWSSGLYHHPHDSLSELNLADYAAAAHYSNRTAGLETAVVGQESASSKDPYWF